MKYIQVGSGKTFPGSATLVKTGPTYLRLSRVINGPERLLSFLYLWKKLLSPSLFLSPPTKGAESSEKPGLMSTLEQQKRMTMEKLLNIFNKRVSECAETIHICAQVFEKIPFWMNLKIQDKYHTTFINEN